MVEMDAKAIIGSFVRRLREQKHLTQDELAARTGITYQYLSGLENGRENFSIGILESLGKALECPLPQLVAGRVRQPIGCRAGRSQPRLFSPASATPPWPQGHSSATRDE